jgi:hypothetical protein
MPEPSPLSGNGNIEIIIENISSPRGIKNKKAVTSFF